MTIADIENPVFNLALAADLRIAGESARFDARFLQIGIHPGGGHTWLLDRAVGPQAAAAIDNGSAAALLAKAYPTRPDGITLFPFRRLFIVARRA